MGKEEKLYQFTDRGMFNWVMTRRPELCAQMLSVILCTKIDDIKVHQEESLEPSLSAKRAILDIKAYSDGRVFDIEMQAAKKGDLAHRARYYQSMLDADSLEKGSNYRELPANYVIFICKDDYLGYGVPKLHFSMQCEKRNGDSLELSDGRHIVFCSARLYNRMLKEEIRDDPDLYELMRFIWTGKAGENSLAKRLETAVAEANEDEGFKMHITYESEMAEWAEAIEELSSENESLKCKLDESEAENKMLRDKLAKLTEAQDTSNR